MTLTNNQYTNQLNLTKLNQLNHIARMKFLYKVDWKLITVREI